MAIAPRGTFGYVAVVPDGASPNGFECHAALREPIVDSGDDSRQATLVVAAGAVTAVPLGNDIDARFPGHLIERAEAVFQECDEEFEFRESPVEIRVRASRAVLLAGRRTLEGYGVVVIHGFLQDDESGTDVCAAIHRTGWCPETAAHASAMLLDLPDALSMSDRL